MLYRYGKILNLSLATLTLLSLSQYGKVSVWEFPIKTALSVNKQLIIENIIYK